jgi:pimeloyl-ACP methyl ester carboxylesterase
MRGYPRNRLTDRPAEEVVNTNTTMSRGHRISYDDTGAGPAIVLLPGWTMSAADWRDAGYVDILATDHRVLNVDPLGNGLSDKPHDPDAYRWPEVAADVIAVMDDAEVDRAVVWGYSRGSSLAASVAAEHPDRVSGLILAGGGDLTTDLPIDAPVDPVELAMWHGDFGPLWEEYDFSAEDRRYDAEVNDPEALGAMEVGLARSGRAIGLDRIAAPTLVLCGGNDDPDQPRKTADALGADLHVLPDLNHVESFSRLDLVMPRVNRFLEQLENQARP